MSHIAFLVLCFLAHHYAFEVFPHGHVTICIFFAINEKEDDFPHYASVLSQISAILFRFDLFYLSSLLS